MELYQDQRDYNELNRILLAFAITIGSGLMFFLNCWADGISSQEYKQFDKPCPYLFSSFLSRLYFDWCTPLIWKGVRNPLTTDNLWSLLPDLNSAKVSYQFEGYVHGKKSVLPALVKAYGPMFLFGATLKLCADLLSLFTPKIMKLMIQFVAESQTGTQEAWKGYFYGIILLLVTGLQSLLLNQYFEKMLVLALKLRTALIGTIYKKSLRVTQASKKESSIGEIVNIMSVDVQKFMDLLPYLNMLWSAPLQLILSTVFLWDELKWGAIVGMGIIVITMPLNFWIGKYLKQFQLEQMKLKDNRIKSMNEILGGIKVLKLYAWENSFMANILSTREKEVKIQKKAAYIGAFMSLFWTIAPFLVGLGSFTFYVLVYGDLTAEKAFVTMSYLNIMRMPLAMLPMMIVFLTQCKVSLDRINKFMNNEELDMSAVAHEESDNAVQITNGTFQWSKDTPTVLKNISIEVPKGSLVAVVGSVGSGKSSLLSAILGEMDKVEGKVNQIGKIGYVPQQAWIQNSTLKDNILFCSPDNDKKYDEVIDACALTTDLEILPAGDQTEIGEKGINLSGGQKQRVSLARAVYSNSDLLLLDDPLSAVDYHVGKHIFNRVIGPNGVLAGKTRILVTHGLTYLPETDHVIVLTNGEVSEQGSYQELLRKNGKFAKFLLEYMQEEADSVFTEELKETLMQTMGETEFQRQQSRKSLSSSVSGYDSENSSEKDTKVGNSVPKTAPTKIPVDKSKLIEKESVQTGSVKFGVYLYYLKNIGVTGVLLTVFLQCCYTSSSVMSNYWLNWWSEKKFEGQESGFYLGIYGAFGGIQAICIMILMIVFNLSALNGSKKMHKGMLIRVIKSPMSFFDTTPLGRIVNRFSKDVDVCDSTLPQNMRSWLSTFANFIGTMISIMTVLPLIIVLFVPSLFIFLIIQKMYVSTSRQLKRLESVSRSPIYSHFGETISGAPTIRAFGLQSDFVKQSDTKVDNNQMCYYPNVIANRWLAIRLEFIGNLITFGSAIFCMVQHGTIKSGDVGFVISYSLSITTVLNWMVRMTADVETNIVGVERIMEYTNIGLEAPWIIDNNRPPKTWPDTGDVTLSNLAIRYREGLDLVIKDINCTIKGGNKIGIVGRTGAGKSSLTVALFRIVESAFGKIEIDGIDISKIGLHDLRQKLTIIPQDPVLFSGTLRMNLDPADTKSDSDVWQALELSNLKPFVEGLEKGLDFEVSEGGENMSVGQRQLVCLARALLRKTKVLILDEATAAVDLETDDLIQRTIRTEFAHCTVLTIAHRLNTIMDYDKIMVLDKGELHEYDSPDNLLSDNSTIFYSLAKDAGLTDESSETYSEKL